MKSMKLVFAPDSFKGSLSATEICALLARAARRVFGDCDIVSIPMADGGEGTLAAVMAATSGNYVDVEAASPLGRRITARYGISRDSTAVIEMAAASGIAIEAENNPCLASSRGTGEMILDAVKRGARRILLGIGGSATNDCGMGMLSALGAVYYDANGEILRGCGADMARVAKVDFSALPNIDITVICDVVNPLLGENGATAIYGPQKGVTDIAFFERGMENCARAMKSAGAGECDFPGAGAAGGVGYALGGVMGAKMRRGIDAVLDISGFDNAVRGAKLVITGEGRLDSQSVKFGKVVAGVAARCRAAGVPVIALCGGLGAGAAAFTDFGDASMFSIVPAPMPLSEAISRAPELYESAAERVFFAVKIGMRINGTA